MMFVKLIKLRFHLVSDPEPTQVVLNRISLKILDATVTSIKTPGPGTYPSPTALSSTGNYFFSKFKNSGAIPFSPPRSSRFPLSKAGKHFFPLVFYLKGDQPGPGAYQTSIGFSPKGHFVSKFKSSMGRTFGTSSRKNLSYTSKALFQNYLFVF